MVVVSKKKGESTDKMLRRFTRLTKDENIAFDVSKKMFYKKPSELKKEKRREKQKRKSKARKRLT